MASTALLRPVPSLTMAAAVAAADMDNAMSHCYDRGNGQYTRLVPVDMLPVELRNIPRRVNTDHGMIVLLVPRQRAARAVRRSTVTSRFTTGLVLSPSRAASTNMRCPTTALPGSPPQPGGGLPDPPSSRETRTR